MTSFSYKEFIEYCSAAIMCDSFKAMPTLVETIVSTKETWFTVLDTYLYSFFVRGYGFELAGKSIMVTNIPEHSADIEVGDVLVTINQMSVLDALIMKPHSGNIELGIMRDGVERKVDFFAPRIEYNPREDVEIMERGEVCFIKISNFSLSTTMSLSNYIRDRKHIVFDLRNHMGGAINELFYFLELFPPLNDYMVLDFENSAGKVYRKKIKPKVNCEGNLKIVDFIVSEKTASSAEIFCLTLRKYYPGIIWGGKTKGKLLVQRLFNVEGCKVCVPIYKYIRPNFFWGNLPAYYHCESILSSIAVLSAPKKTP